MAAHRKYHPIAPGMRYGRLVAIEFSRLRRRSALYWAFYCDCGTKKEIRVAHVQAGKVVSCGCNKDEKNRTHGLSHLPEYKVWAAMIARCKNPTNPNFANYGGRGIRVCRRWRKFANFIADMGTRPFAGASLDREDNNKGYSPANCRWTTIDVQVKNTRRSRLINYKGQLINLVEASKLAGVNPSTMWHRINNGWDVVKAVETPPLNR